MVHVRSPRPGVPVALIRRNGIRRLRRSRGQQPGGIFAVPMTRNFYVSHQWLRELRRRNQGAIAGVYFGSPTTTPFSSVTTGRAISR